MLRGPSVRPTISPGIADLAGAGFDEAIQAPESGKLGSTTLAVRLEPAQHTGYVLALVLAGDPEALGEGAQPVGDLFQAFELVDGHVRPFSGPRSERAQWSFHGYPSVLAGTGGLPSRLIEPSRPAQREKDPARA